MEKNYIIGIIGLILLVLLINVSTGVFTSGPEINPLIGTTYTYHDLTCQWTINETATVYVNWYRNGVLNTTYSRNCTANTSCDTEGTGIISKTYTAKNDIWICEVIYDVGTGNESQNDTIIIEDSLPTTPKVFLNNIEILNNSMVNISEDYATAFQVNSTDADNDTITYVTQPDEVPSFCSITSTSGVFNCSPTEESDIGIHNVTVYAKTGVVFIGFVFYINVTQTNDAPYFSTVLEDKLIPQGNALNYTIIGADAEANTPYGFYISTTLGSVIIENISATSAIIKFNNSGEDISTFYDRGNHTVTVFINDSGNPSLTHNSTFNLEVVPVNQLPNITIYVDNSTNLTQGGPLLVLINATDLNNDTPLTFYSSNVELYNISYGSTDTSNPSGISYANGTIYVASLTNNHVINRNITITVDDGKENNTQTVFFNITNVNDAPIINEISNYSGNTLNNKNISNLLAYVGVFFWYRVNATDVDSYTYEGETLNFSSSDNASFPINSSGVISFMPDTEGNFTYNITVKDRYNATFNQTATIHIYPNNKPVFNETNITLQCYEYDINNHPNNCYYNMSAYVNETDIGDYIADFWTNSTLFNISNITGIINFMVNQTDIGVYPIMFNATDSRGGINSTTIYLIINNTNNKPIINQTVFISPGRLVIGNTYNIYVYAYDYDLQLNNSYENLTFLMNVTGRNTSIFTITKSSNTSARISFNPVTTSDSGNYTINITVRDYYNNLSTPKSIDIIIYNITNPPNITAITPYGTPLLTNSVSISWAGTSNFTDMRTNITISENTTYTFNQTTIADNVSYSNFLNYSWSYDGINTNITTQHYTKYFDFFSSGRHNITFFTLDEFNKSATFTWWINVTNFNRPPILRNPLDNLTGDYVVNKSTNYNGYMYQHGSPLTYKFYDPDDDLDSNSTIDDGENNTLTYAATSCEHANFVFIGTTLRVETVSVGECIVNFTAIDSMNSSMNVTSYDVIVNVTAVSNDTTPEPTPISVSGGGGSSTRTITIPVPEEVERPKPLQILTPKLVTVYKNATVKVPIVLNNTWNDTLEGIRLSVYTNASNVTVYIDKTYFPSIRTGATEEVTLTIGNYKSEGHYEIQVYANVSNPEYRDIATIFVNSADMKSEGEELESMISFAQDLLSSNPECQELTELLTQAKKELSSDNFDTTARLVDSVINGCKYLASTSKNVEQPGSSFIKTFEWNTNYNRYLIVIGFFILFVTAAYYLMKKDTSDKEF
jgi:hypothetical protein